MLRQTPVKPVDVEDLGSIITPPSKEYAAIAEVHTLTFLIRITSACQKRRHIFQTSIFTWLFNLFTDAHTDTCLCLNIAKLSHDVAKLL